MNTTITPQPTPVLAAYGEFKIVEIYQTERPACFDFSAPVVSLCSLPEFQLYLWEQLRHVFLLDSVPSSSVQLVAMIPKGLDETVALSEFVAHGGVFRFAPATDETSLFQERLAHLIEGNFLFPISKWLIFAELETQKKKTESELLFIIL